MVLFLAISMLLLQYINIVLIKSPSLKKAISNFKNQMFFQHSGHKLLVSEKS